MVQFRYRGQLIEAWCFLHIIVPNLFWLWKERGKKQGKGNGNKKWEKNSNLNKDAVYSFDNLRVCCIDVLSQV